MIDLDLIFNYENSPMHFVLQVEQGERLAIIGESGAGKSTLLNLIAGFEMPTSGQILLNHCDHTQTQPAERPVSMLFQDNNPFSSFNVGAKHWFSASAKLIAKCYPTATSKRNC